MRLAGFTLVAVLVASGPARANGRLPAPLSVNYQHEGPEIIVGATFGLMVSRDGTRNYRWICEQAIGYGGYWDPIVQINKNGVILVSAFDGLARSEDGGCSWGYAHGDALGHWIDGLIAHPTDPNVVFVATSTGGKTNAIMKSTDAGKTFTAVSGTESPLQFFKSLIMAPGNPMRMYATSYTITPETTTLWKSVNGGQSFAPIDFPYKGGASFKVIAVSPASADMVFVRIDSPPPVGGGDVDTIIYRSVNGGLDFAPVSRTPTNVKSAAISNDGQTVVLSSEALEIRRAVNGGTSFTPVVGSYSRCASNHDGTLNLCTNQYAMGFAAMISPSFGADLDYTGLMSFRDLKGPISCPAGALASWLPEPNSTDMYKRSRATKELCDPLWASTEVQIGNAANDAGLGPDAAVTPDAGTKPRDPTTCGCRAGGRDRAPGGWAIGAIGLFLVVLMRRRRTCARPR